MWDMRMRIEPSVFNAASDFNRTHTINVNREGKIQAQSLILIHNCWSTNTMREGDSLVSLSNTHGITIKFQLKVSLVSFLNSILSLDYVTKESCEIFKVLQSRAKKKQTQISSCPIPRYVYLTATIMHNQVATHTPCFALGSTKSTTSPTFSSRSMQSSVRRHVWMSLYLASTQSLNAWLRLQTRE
jgi:hypothetical protein